MYKFPKEKIEENQICIDGESRERASFPVQASHPLHHAEGLLYVLSRKLLRDEETFLLNRQLLQSSILKASTAVLPPTSCRSSYRRLQGLLAERDTALIRPLSLMAAIEVKRRKMRVATTHPSRPSASSMTMSHGSR